MFFSPSPSMSKARREQKWISRSTPWAGKTSPPGPGPAARRCARGGGAPKNGPDGVAAPRRRQFCRHRKGLRALRPLVEYDRDDLRDDVAGALDHHRVTVAEILARDFV